MRAWFGSILAGLASTALFAVRADAQPAAQYGVNSTPRGVQADLALASELGAGAIRFPFYWQMAEPRQNGFEWSEVDRIVKEARERKIELLFVLRVISPWGTTRSSQQRGIYRSGSPPTDLADWARFVEELAARYRGQGVHYEVENEVAGPAFWSGTLEEYLALLKVTYPAIKRGDPHAMVLPSAMGCGIVRNRVPSQIWQRHDQWLAAILATKAFDVVNVHNYYFPSEITANGWTFRTYLQHIQGLARQAGVGDRPVWITEAGYVSQPTNAVGRLDDGSPEKQARWLGEAYRQAAELGVERLFWLLLRDRQESYFGSMGLADVQGNPRPAWGALQQLIRSAAR